MQFQIHQFMCPLCGRETIPIARKSGQLRKQGHRKWLYCPWCHKQVNTYECRSYEEILTFNERFASGDIQKEYAEEIASLDPQFQHA